MKKNIFYSLILFFALTSQAQTKYFHAFSDSLYRCNYSARGNNGMLENSYTSYYKNGKIKALGQFKNNLRTGLWTVWDSTGRMRMQRDYKSVFEYKRVFPPISNAGPIPLVSQDKYVPKRNAHGYYEYAYLKEMDVYASTRIWQTVYKNGNEWIFKNNAFFDTLCKLILHDSISEFHVPDTILVFEDDDFIVPKRNAPFIEVVGLKIKEDWFFDKLRLISETRILGICPIVKVKSAEGDFTKEIELGWLYYPTIRKALAAQKVSIEGCPNITNLDDVFINRYFGGEIYKETNYWDRKIADYTSNVQKESTQIKLNLIDWEHNIWLEFTK